jgi:hypothetical protein
VQFDCNGGAVAEQAHGRVHARICARLECHRDGIAKEVGIMLRTVFYLLGSLLIARNACAHHGWSEYDTANALNATGVITESGYEHPHGHVRLQTAGKTWLVVLAPPSRMESRGLGPADLKPGTTVTVVGYQNRGKPEEMRAERITVNAKTTELR